MGPISQTSRAEWFYDRGGVKVGPFSAETMHELAAAGQVAPDTMVWSGTSSPAPFGSGVLLPKQAAPAPSADAAASDWYYARNGSRIGPVSRDELIRLAGAGEIQDDTPVWHPTLGSSFVRFGGSGLKPSRAPVPPGTANTVSNSLVWPIVALPLASALVDDFFRLNDGPFSQAFMVATFVANGALCYLDERRLARADAVDQANRLGLWWWLVPVYLWKRASVLRGTRLIFWAWIASFAASMVVDQWDVLAGDTYAGVGLPACDSGYQVRQAKKVFDQLNVERATGIAARSVSGVREIGERPEIRTCVAALTANDGRTYRITYTVERNGDQLYTHLSAR